MLSLEDLIRTYTKVIGGGGYGVVKTGVGDPYDKFAVKFLFKSLCPSAKNEFITNKFVYTAYEIFIRCNPVPAVHVVRPYDFTSHDCIINCNNNEYLITVPTGKFIKSEIN